MKQVHKGTLLMIFGIVISILSFALIHEYYETVHTYIIHIMSIVGLISIFTSGMLIQESIDNA